MLGDPSDPFSALKLLVPDSGKRHATLVLLLAGEGPCTAAGCTLSQELAATPWGFQLLLAWKLQSSVSTSDLAP